MKSKRTVKYTDANAIKAYVRYHSPDSKESQGALAKYFNVHAGTMSNWIRKVRDTPALLAKAKEQLQRKDRSGKTAPYADGGPATTPLERSVDKIVALEEENKFLKWWNLGERSGWVNELLKRIGRDENE